MYIKTELIKKKIEFKYIILLLIYIIYFYLFL